MKLELSDGLFGCLLTFFLLVWVPLGLAATLVVLSSPIMILVTAIALVLESWNIWLTAYWIAFLIAWTILQWD